MSEHPHTELLRRIVQAANRRPNTDGTIKAREWAQQMVPTELIEEAEAALSPQDGQPT
jgi:hypothetical protein